MVGLAGRNGNTYRYKATTGSIQYLRGGDVGGNWVRVVTGCRLAFVSLISLIAAEADSHVWCHSNSGEKRHPSRFQV